MEPTTLLESLSQRDDSIRRGEPFDLGGVRMTPTPARRGISENVQLTNPLITALVTGQAELRSDWMDFIAPAQTTTTLKNDYPIFAGTEQVKRQQVRRPAGAEYGFTVPVPSKATFTLHRDSWSSKVDVQTIRNSEAGLRMAEKFAGLAERVVRKAQEFELRDIIDDTTTASYAAGHTVTLAGAAEWDASGVDPRDSVNTGINQIVGALLVERTQIRMFLPDLSLRALYSSTAWRDWNSGTSQPRTPANPQAAIIADFFGIGAVQTALPAGQDEGASVVAALFGDNAYMFVPDLSGEYDVEYGFPRWISRIEINRGVAGEPFFIGERSSFMYPWDHETKFEVFKNNAAYRIANTAA